MSRALAEPLIRRMQAVLTLCLEGEHEPGLVAQVSRQTKLAACFLCPFCLVNAHVASHRAAAACL